MLERMSIWLQLRIIEYQVVVTWMQEGATVATCTALYDNLPARKLQGHVAAAYNYFKYISSFFYVQHYAFNNNGTVIEIT